MKITLKSEIKIFPIYIIIGVDFLQRKKKKKTGYILYKFVSKQEMYESAYRTYVCMCEYFKDVMYFFMIYKSYFVCSIRLLLINLLLLLPLGANKNLRRFPRPRFIS